MSKDCLNIHVVHILMEKKLNMFMLSFLTFYFSLIKYITFFY
jgi:hypothetical protein